MTQFETVLITREDGTFLIQEHFREMFENAVKIDSEESIQKLRLVNPTFKPEISSLQSLIDERITCLPRCTDTQHPHRIYTLIDKIGEGTFSTVYRAIDEGYCSYKETRQNEKVWYEKHSISYSKRENVVYLPKRYVAVKRIYQTSSPARQQSEIELIALLEGRNNCVALLDAFRVQDQIVLVMPYFEHQEFRHYMHVMTVTDIGYYMERLLAALTHVHAQQIIHRDIKPANFLYNYEERKGMLVDFGLAQFSGDLENNIEKYELSSAKKRKILDNKWMDEKTGRPYSLETLHHTRAGIYAKDPRPAFKAPRAGTRGFRAPEVLFRYPLQTTSIDVWAAGVILLSLIANQFPIFNSQDDPDALVEVACVYGNEEMKKCAEKYERVWMTNIPTVPEKRIPWRSFCYRFNPKFVEDAPDELFDLLDKMMEPTHTKRWSAASCLFHPFFKTQKISKSYRQ